MPWQCHGQMPGGTSKIHGQAAATVLEDQTLRVPIQMDTMKWSS